MAQQYAAQYAHNYAQTGGHPTNEHNPSGPQYAAAGVAPQNSWSPGQTGYLAQPSKVSPVASHMLSAGLFGVIVAGTSAMGTNLHKVQKGDMSLGEALSQSLLRGTAAGVATAAAFAAAGSLTRGGLLGLGVTLATATGVSYLISKE